MTQQQKPEYRLEGHWIVRENSDCQVKYVVGLDDTRGNEVATLLHKANTQPDLLEACERALSIFKQLAEVGKYPEMLLQENGGEGLMFLETAISNAKGGGK